MSQVQSLLTSAAATTGSDPRLVVWNAAQASSLAAACVIDAECYWYSGLVSLGESMRGVDLRTFSWATVKAYYATFYLSRASLGFSNGSVNFYNGTGARKGHYSVSAQAGTAPRKIRGNTHDAVLKHVEAEGTIQQLAGQPIGAEPTAWQWLMAQRNEANYTRLRFSDPSPTGSMTYASAKGIRRIALAYYQDTSLTYTFDADHAILAYPITLARILASTRVPGFGIESETHLDSLFRDSAGPLSFVRPLYRPN